MGSSKELWDHPDPFWPCYEALRRGALEEVVSRATHWVGTWVGWSLGQVLLLSYWHTVCPYANGSLRTLLPEGNVPLGLEGWARLLGWGWTMVPGTGVRNSKVG